MYFSNDKEVLGIIAVQDMAKESSIRAIAQLKKDGYKLDMVTGDSENTAESIRKRLNIDEKYAQVLPHEKDKVVKELQNLGKKSCYGW